MIAKARGSVSLAARPRTPPRKRKADDSSHEASVSQELSVQAAMRYAEKRQGKLVSSRACTSKSKPETKDSGVAQTDPYQ